jgi:hypothetical protein
MYKFSQMQYGYLPDTYKCKELGLIERQNIKTVVFLDGASMSIIEFLKD